MKTVGIFLVVIISGFAIGFYVMQSIELIIFGSAGIFAP
jgi:hypothetical protein